jgi:hypothetical protein
MAHRLGHDIEQPAKAGGRLLIICFTACRSRESKKTSAHLSDCRLCRTAVVLGAMVCGVESK